LSGCFATGVFNEAAPEIRGLATPRLDRARVLAAMMRVVYC
jgi:exopolyphosphatase/guanosine-5'-triphosphate,3'-diphosphate pyrophosphatase